MVGIPALEVETRLEMNGRGVSPLLRMGLDAEHLEAVGKALETLSEPLSRLLSPGLDEDAETIAAKAVQAYRGVIDAACGEGSSGRVVKWIAAGSHVSDYDLALRLAPVVEWVCEKYSEAAGGLSG